MLGTSDDPSAKDSTLPSAASSSSSAQEAGASIDATLSAPASSSSDPSTSQATPEKKKPKKWDPLTIPGPEQLQMEDLMNNCIVKGALSCAMGGVAGLAFGLFSASIENAAVSAGDACVDCSVCMLVVCMVLADTIACTCLCMLCVHLHAVRLCPQHLVFAACYIVRGSNNV